MRRLDRYILRETLYPSLIGLAALTFVAVSRELGTLLESIVRQSATPAQIWAVVGALLPTVLKFTLPMAVLVGILTGFGRLSSDSETIALRASGVSMRRILVPVLVLGIAAWIVNMTMTAWIAPEMAARLNRLKSEIMLRQGQMLMQNGVFNEENPGITLYVRSISPNGTEWRDIMYDDAKDPTKEVITFAETGVPSFNQADQSIQVSLTNGNTHIIVYDKAAQYTYEEFKQRTVSIPTESLSSGSRDPEASLLLQASTKSLWQRMQNGTATYSDRVEFHQRFALPFACIAFVFVGLPLGVSTTRGSKSMGLVISLVLMFLYYLAFMGGTKLAEDSNFSPFLGAWIPNLVFLMIGLFLMSRADREHESYVLLSIRWLSQWLGEKKNSITSIGQHFIRRLHTFSHRSKFIRVIDRYVIRGFWFYFMLVLVVFIGLFTIVTLFELLPDIVKNHVSASTVVLYFIFLTPQMLFWVAPLTVLLAILINLGTLTKANEILAVKASGVSLYRLSLPLLFMGLLISCAIYVMQDFTLPYTNRRQDEYRNIIKAKQPQSYRHPERKWMAGTNDRIYHYSAFNYQKNEFSNLSIFKFAPDTFNLREWTFATNGSWNGKAWELRNVAVHRVNSEGVDPTSKPQPTLITTDMDNPEYFKDEVRTASQMNYSELRRYINELQKKRFDVKSLTLELHRKLSFPMVSFIMVMIGIPFSFKTGKKGAFYGIGICIGMGILYWSTFELFAKLGEIDRLSPIIAAWFPNLIFGLGGTWMMLRVKT